MNISWDQIGEAELREIYDRSDLRYRMTFEKAMANPALVITLRHEVMASRKLESLDLRREASRAKAAPINYQLQAAA
jgi:hypothetical protein